jgi:serine/threonine protein kinase
MVDFIGQSIGRYHILEKLGEGGMAIVYKAFDTSLECDVAVKFIRTQKLAQDNVEKTLQRFKNEAQKTAGLTHPNIVPVIDYGKFENTPYLVMKYMPGGTLKQAHHNRLRNGLGPYSYQEAAAILAPIARALELAHQSGLVHRDVKPSNILMTQTGQPMLTDFGVAKILEESDKTIDHTGLGVGIGTPEYMAPEQWEGKGVDGRADIYALGVVFYELITGRTPFRAETIPAMMIKALRDPLPRPSTFVKDIPDSVELVIYKAMAREVKDRYADMSLFAQALERLSSDKAEKAKPLKKPVPVSQNSLANEPVPGGQNQSKSKVLYYLIGVLVLVVLFTVGGFWVWRNPALSPQQASGGKTLAPMAVKAADTETSVVAQEVQATPPRDGATVQGSPTATPPVGNASSSAIDAPGQTEPSEKVIYSEDFEQGFAHGFEFGPGNWSVVDDGTGNKVLEQNMSGNPTGSNFGPGVFSDGIIEFRFRVVSENPQTFPVVLTVRHQQESGAEYIVSYFAPDGSTGISYAENNGGWQDMEAYAGSGKAFPYPKGSWVKMRMVANGDKMEVFLNGNLIITASDSRLSTGNLTIGTGPNIAVQFDDIKITELSSPT